MGTLPIEAVRSDERPFSVSLIAQREIAKGKTPTLPRVPRPTPLTRCGWRSEQVICLRQVNDKSRPTHQFIEKQSILFRLKPEYVLDTAQAARERKGSMI